MLVVEVEDNGVGGARIEPGGGLEGLTTRVGDGRRHAHRLEPRRRPDDRPGGAAVRVVIARTRSCSREGLVAPARGRGDRGRRSAVGDGDALLVAVERHRPDLAIVDVRMPPTHTDEGLRAAIEARARVPETAILVLSQYVEERYASDLLAAGGVGVGYLLKERVADVGEFVESRAPSRGRRNGLRPGGDRAADGPPPPGRPALGADAAGARGADAHGRGPAATPRSRRSCGSRSAPSRSTSARSSPGSASIPGEDENRRVRAVLTYLEGSRGSA